MKTRALKTAVLVAEIFGELIAVAAACAGYLFWRLEQGPLQVGVIEAAAETAINRQLPEGHVADVARVWLQKNRDTGAYQLVLSDMFVWDQSGRAVLRLDSARLEFPSRDVISARFRPTEIVLESPTIDLVRGKDRKFRVDYGAIDQPARGETNLSKILNASPYFKETFQTADIINATVLFLDEASGRLWRSDGATATVRRSAKGFAASLNADFDGVGGASTIRLDAELDRLSGIFDANVSLNNAPVGDLIEVFVGATAATFDAPVSGEAHIRLTDDGKILSSRLSGVAGGGSVRFGEFETTVRSMKAKAEFDPESNLFKIDEFTLDTDRAAATLSGLVEARFRNDSQTLDSLEFDLFSEQATLEPNGVFEEPLEPEKLRLVGSYDFANKAFSATSLEASIFNLELAGAASFRRFPEVDGAAPSPEAQADFDVVGVIDDRTLMKLWPKTTGLGARDFVRDRISNATVDGLKAVLNLPAGAIDAEGGLPNDALSVTFNINDATVVYAPGMTPLTGASGAAELKGNYFRVDVPKARIGDVSLSNGEVEFVAFRPKGAASYFRFDAKGDVGDVLAVLDQKPFSLLKATPLEPRMFNGDISARIEIMRPNRRVMPLNQYEFSGNATFANLNIDEFYGAVGLNDASGKLKLRSDGMVVDAEAKLGGAPVTMHWEQEFYSKGDRSRFSVAGVVDSSTGDVLGVPTRQFLRGPVTFDAKARGDIASFRSLSINADFTDATLLVEPLGWAKLGGAPAAALVNLSFTDDRATLEKIEITGDDIAISGSAAFSTNGRIESATFEKFLLGDTADLQFRAARSADDALELSLTGDRVDASALLETFFDSAGVSESAGEPVDWGPGLKLKSRVENFELRNGVVYSDAVVDFWRDRERIQTLDISARDPHGDLISVGLAHTGANDGPRQTVVARTDDIGDFMSGVFGLQSIVGGEGVVDLYFEHGDEDEEVTGFTGDVEARNIRIVGAPLLARIFAAGSFDGLSDLLRGDGIMINQAFSAFAVRDGALFLRDMRAAGPSVGMSAEGRIAGEANGGIDLNGAVAPAYQVNSFLGRTPIVGDLFVNRDGEGIVAVSYRVTGSPSETTVSVNPLSALTPGFLRRIFEPQRKSLEEMMDDGADEPPTQDQPEN